MDDKRKGLSDVLVGLANIVSYCVLLDIESK